MISSYLVANEETWRRGITLSFASALLQALVAVAVVGVAAVLLGAGATPLQARTALFHQAATASEGREAVMLPPICDVLARLGKTCP